MMYYFCVVTLRNPTELQNTNPGFWWINIDITYSRLLVKETINIFMLETIVCRVFSYELILADREQNIQGAILAKNKWRAGKS